MLFQHSHTFLTQQCVSHTQLSCSRHPSLTKAGADINKPLYMSQSIFPPFLQVKCDQYWPTRGTETYGLIQVTLLDTVELATYSVRTFALYKVKVMVFGSLIIHNKSEILCWETFAHQYICTLFIQSFFALNIQNYRTDIEDQWCYGTLTQRIIAGMSMLSYSTLFIWR